MPGCVEVSEMDMAIRHSQVALVAAPRDRYQVLGDIVAKNGGPNMHIAANASPRSKYTR
jgi:hypothetical protein